MLILLREGGRRLSLNALAVRTPLDITNPWLAATAPRELTIFDVSENEEMR